VHHAEDSPEESDAGSPPWGDFDSSLSRIFASSENQSVAFFTCPAVRGRAPLARRLTQRKVTVTVPLLKWASHPKVHHRGDFRSGGREPRDRRRSSRSHPQRGARLSRTGARESCPAVRGRAPLARRLTQRKVTVTVPLLKWALISTVVSAGFSRAAKTRAWRFLQKHQIPRSARPDNIRLTVSAAAGRASSPSRRAPPDRIRITGLIEHLAKRGIPSLG
jgi:hypothetical protein